LNSFQNQKNDKECVKKVNTRLMKFIECLTHKEVSRPVFKFICEAVGGILISGNLIIRSMAVALMEDNKAPGTVEKRISLHLRDEHLHNKINSWLLKSGLADYFHHYNNERLHQSLNYETPSSYYFSAKATNEAA